MSIELYELLTDRLELYRELEKGIKSLDNGEKFSEEKVYDELAKYIVFYRIIDDVKQIVRIIEAFKKVPFIRGLFSSWVKKSGVGGNRRFLYYIFFMNFQK